MFRGSFFCEDFLNQRRVWFSLNPAASLEGTVNSMEQKSFVKLMTKNSISGVALQPEHRPCGPGAPHVRGGEEAGPSLLLLHGGPGRGGTIRSLPGTYAAGAELRA